MVLCKFAIPKHQENRLYFIWQQDVSISINGENISRVFVTKFLGVLIQANLKWNEHISLLANKLSKTIGVLNKVKYILNTTHLKLLYHSLIEPYLNYCCIIWANPQKK